VLCSEQRAKSSDAFPSDHSRFEHGVPSTGAPGGPAQLSRNLPSAARPSLRAPLSSPPLPPRGGPRPQPRRAARLRLLVTTVYARRERVSWAPGAPPWRSPCPRERPWLPTAKPVSPCSLLLSCIALNSYVLHCTALHCTALHCSVLNWTALHCTVLKCNVSH